MSVQGEAYYIRWQLVGLALGQVAFGLFNLTHKISWQTNSGSLLSEFRLLLNVFFNISIKILCGGRIFRQEQFEKSAAGRAARAQMQGMAKQSANSNKGEPVLKVLLFKMLIFPACLF